MHAIRRINFQFLRGSLFHHFIDGRGAKILTGIAKFLHAFCRTDIQILHFQVAGLILFMPRAGVIDVGEPIERQLAVALEAFRRGAAKMGR